MQSATELFNQAIENVAPAPAADPVPAPPEPALATEGAAPETAPPDPPAPEGEPDPLAALSALGVPKEKLAEAQKLFNDAKSRKGRELAEKVRQYEAQMSDLQAKAQKAEALESQFKQFEPLLSALKPPEPKPDPIKDNPTFKALISKGYSEEQLSAIMALAKAAVEPQIQAIQQQRAQEEFELQRDAYLASIMEPSPENPAGWRDVAPLIEATVSAHPEIGQTADHLLMSGASPKVVIDYLRGQVVLHNPGAFSGQAAPPAAPPAPAPGKATAAPMRGASTPAPTPLHDTNAIAAQFLEAARRAK